MSEFYKNNYFILTGAMGSGKSTILNELRKLNITCMDEPARQILAEQRCIEGDGVPDKNEKLFTDLLLSRSLYQYKQMQEYDGPVIFDRGIPDNLAYANLFELNSEITENAANQYRYHSDIFFLPAWQAIYDTDDERKMTFEQSAEFGLSLRKIYEQIGYNIVDVPLDSPVARAEFIVTKLQENT